MCLGSLHHFLALWRGGYHLAPCIVLVVIDVAQAVLLRVDDLRLLAVSLLIVQAAHSACFAVQGGCSRLEVVSPVPVAAHALCDVVVDFDAPTWPNLK